MLLNEDTGSHLLYSCLVYGLRGQGKVMKTMMVQPRPQTVNGQRAYRFMFGGFLWIYAVASHAMTGPLKELVLSPMGKLQF